MTLREAAQLALDAHIALREWINAVPQDTQLPSMPGIDGDWLDDVEHQLRQALAEPEQPARVPLPIEKIEACMKRAYAAAAGSRNLEICFAREIEADHGITAKPASVQFLPGEYETLTERGAMAWAGYDAKDDGK